MSDTYEPTADECRTLLGLNETALSNAKFGTFLTFAYREVTNTSDTMAILYYVCWMIADQAQWSYVTRLGDQSYSGPDPMVWKSRYEKRCQDLNITPTGTGYSGGLRKVHSENDDYPNNLSISRNSYNTPGGGTFQ